MDMTTLAISVAIGCAVGFAAGYNAHESRIQDCVEQAEQLSGYGPIEARAIMFAQCVSPRQYDPEYNYKRFKGK
ncbi:MAG: hypothetical protein Q8K18_19385 [Burkholderiales bacterium]|nr:hypothetical protein [Burkholderiales bacterium]